MTESGLNQLVAQILAILAPAMPHLQEIAKGAASTAGTVIANKAHILLNNIRERFTREKDEEAVQTLQLYTKNPKRFEGALAEILLTTLQKHPEFAQEISELLAEPSLQEVIAKNDSEVHRIELSLSGVGIQRIITDNSTVTDVKITKK